MKIYSPQFGSKLKKKTFFHEHFHLQFLTRYFFFFTILYFCYELPHTHYPHSKAQCAGGGGRGGDSVGGVVCSWYGGVTMTLDVF